MVRNKKSGLFKKFRRIGWVGGYMLYSTARRNYSDLKAIFYSNFIEATRRKLLKNAKDVFKFVNCNRKVGGFPSVMSFENFELSDACVITNPFVNFFGEVYQ